MQEETVELINDGAEAPVGLAAEAARKKLDKAFDPTTARDYVKPAGPEDKAIRGPRNGKR
jgi:hypothetical protein